MLPSFFHIEEENNLIRSSKFYPWLSQENILEIIKSCNDTLEYYKKYNIDNDRIEELNNQWCDKEYMLYNKSNITKEKIFVYLMIDYNTNLVKIGRSKNPEQRERTLQSEKPTIEMIYNFKCEYGTEKQLHDKYKDKRVRGEWFKLDNNDINEIKNNYK